MIPRFLLDTNVVLGVLGGGGTAAALIERHGATPATSAVCQLTRLELLGFHAITRHEDAVIRDFLAAVGVIATDTAIERAAIEIRRRTRLKLPDAIVLGTARVYGLTLLTLDHRLALAAGV